MPLASIKQARIKYFTNKLSLFGGLRSLTGLSTGSGILAGLLTRRSLLGLISGRSAGAGGAGNGCARAGARGKRALINLLAMVPMVAIITAAKGRRVYAYKFTKHHSSSLLNDVSLEKISNDSIDCMSCCLLLHLFTKHFLRQYPANITNTNDEIARLATEKK